MFARFTALTAVVALVLLSVACPAPQPDTKKGVSPPTGPDDQPIIVIGGSLFIGWKGTYVWAKDSEAKWSHPQNSRRATAIDWLENGTAVDTFTVTTGQTWKVVVKYCRILSGNCEVGSNKNVTFENENTNGTGLTMESDAAIPLAQFRIPIDGENVLQHPNHNKQVIGVDIIVGTTTTVKACVNADCGVKIHFICSTTDCP